MEGNEYLDRASKAVQQFEKDLHEKWDELYVILNAHPTIGPLIVPDIFKLRKTIEECVDQIDFLIIATDGAGAYELFLEQHKIIISSIEDLISNAHRLSAEKKDWIQVNE